MPTSTELRKLRREARERFSRSRRAEIWYSRQLRRISRAIDDIVRGLLPVTTEEIDERTASTIERMLSDYAELLDPWARTVGERMLAEVGQRDMRAWSALGREIGRNLRTEIATAPTGKMMRDALADQVHLIKSLPLEAAQRVHDLATESLSTGKRSKAIVQEILESGDVSRSRAQTIARTETARAATELLQARSTSIGSTHFIWTTVGDRDVRPEHRARDGQVYPWPMKIEPNCRCWAIPVIPPALLGRAA